MIKTLMNFKLKSWSQLLLQVDMGYKWDVSDAKRANLYEVSGPYEIARL